MKKIEEIIIKMNEEKFIEELESGKIIELNDAGDFLQACKLCRKRYGRKSVMPADDGLCKQCVVLIKQISPTEEKSGRFRLMFRKMRDYCIAKKITLDEFNALYIGQRSIKKQQQDFRFMKSKDKFITKYCSLYRKLSMKKRELLIKKIEEM
jgi:hypothetical protein